MKQAINILSLFVIITLAASCKKKTVNLHEEFTLGFNKTAIVKGDGEKMEIKFTQLVSESRCQPNTECFWAGEVLVKIQLDGSEESTLGLLSTSAPSSVEYKNHTISLLEVNYDSPSHFGEESHYSLRLKVE